MDQLEYNYRLRCAREIARNQKWQNRADRVKDKWIKILLFFTLFTAVFNVAKVYADYNVSFFVCSVCNSSRTSPSCCQGAHFTEYEYSVKGDPP